MIIALFSALYTYRMTEKEKEKEREQERQTEAEGERAREAGWGYIANETNQVRCSKSIW